MLTMRILKHISPAIICLFAVLLIAILLPACNTLGLAPKTAKPPLEVGSLSFTGGEKIPVKYTCDGEDISPELHWSGAFSSTKSYAVVVSDYDAPSGTFYHWLVYNIPAGTDNLREGVNSGELSSMGATQLKNGFGKIGYGGPCPPRDSLHHYHFAVYGLDRTLNLPADATVSQLLNAIEDHKTARGSTSGTFRH